MGSCGTYGASSAAISSGSSVNASAATASSSWLSLVAPMMGAVITGFCSTQASATCARGTPRAAATAVSASTTLRSASAVLA